MKISVVIPAYNEEKNLPFLLKSLQQQHFPKSEFEIIVVDNNSSDATADVAQGFGAKVVYEFRQGITYARDTGVRAAGGKIIVGTDADCILPKHFLSNVYKRFKHDKKLFGLCGSISLPDAPLLVQCMAFFLSCYGTWYSQLLSRTPITWALNFSFRRDAFLKIGGYRLDLPLLERGINTDGSDEQDLAKRFTEVSGNVIFDRRLILQASGRRFNKGRFMYWFLIEHLLAFSLNRLLYKHFGFILPVPSYYERRTPRFAESVFLNILFVGTISVFVSMSFLFLSAPQSEAHNQGLLRKSVASYKEYQKFLVSKVLEPVKTSVPFRGRSAQDEETNFTTGFIPA